MTEDQDARLVALLDGALPEAKAEALRAEIAADPDVQARLDSLDVNLSSLSAQADALLADAPQMSEGATPRGSLAGLAMAASVALALVLGGALIGSRFGGGEDWRDFAAAYHLLYQPETLAAPMQGDGGVAQVSEALGQDLSALADVEGLDFRRAQILGWQDQTLIQFAYLDTNGRPVAVCIMENTDDIVGVSTSTAHRHGLATTTLTDRYVRVLVIGPDADTDTQALGQSVAAQLGMFSRS